MPTVDDRVRKHFEPRGSSIGDRLSALEEQLQGGDVDVITGDYLAELTMLILGRDKMKDPTLGYARTFVKQAEECMGLALERGVRIVSNAGGLNPAGLAGRLQELVDNGLGMTVPECPGAPLQVVPQREPGEQGRPLHHHGALGRRSPHRQRQPGPRP